MSITLDDILAIPGNRPVYQRVRELLEVTFPERRRAKREDQGTAGQQFHDHPMATRWSRLGGLLERSETLWLDEQTQGDYPAAAVVRGTVGEEEETRRSASSQQRELEMGWEQDGNVIYEHAVLVTNMVADILTLAQHYRDRGDSENNFDELKNQWGWLGYTTHDHARSEMMTLFVALVYNWWSLFARLSTPNRRAEAITSRPLLLHAIGRKTSHSNQSTLTLTSLHAAASTIQAAVKAVTGFLSHVRSIAEQFKPGERWRLMLLAIVRAFPLTRTVNMA